MWFFSLTRARNTHFGSPSLPFRYFLSSGFQRTARGLGLTGSHTRQVGWWGSTFVIISPLLTAGSIDAPPLGPGTQPVIASRLL
jgi:hypothetical protein